MLSFLKCIFRYRKQNNTIKDEAAPDTTPSLKKKNIYIMCSYKEAVGL